MLELVIPATELFDEARGKIFTTQAQTLTLEHSLVSLSKWEAKWCKPFLSDKPQTFEETIDYIRCMTITKNVDPKVYEFITNQNIQEVKEYIDRPMTATTFPTENPGPRRTITAEVIYSWMFAYSIPLDLQKWHLNRLLAQIKVCQIHNQPAKKMGRKEQQQQQRMLNEQRKAALHTKG